MKKDELRELVDKGILQENPVPEILNSLLKELVKDGFLQKLPNDFFAFNNNVTWEVIYETLLFSERRHLHKLVANHIEQFNRDNYEPVADLLLHHYTESNSWNKCIKFASIAGDRAAQMYAIEDSLNSYNKILSALNNLPENNNIDECLTHEHIGDIYLTAGQDKNANNSFKKSLAIYRENTENKPKDVPWTYNKNLQEPMLCRKIAMAYQGLAEYDLSLQWLDEAIDKLPQRPGRVASQIYASKSGTYYRKGQLQDALKWGKKALQIAKRLKSVEDIAYAYRILANSYMWAGQSREAIELLINAIKHYEELEDLVGLSTSNINLGVCYQLVSELDLSNKYYESAIIYCKRIQNESLSAIAHNNLGEVLMLRGKLDDAITNFEETVKSYELGKSEKPLAGLALMNICRCYRYRGDLIHAEENLNRGRALLDEVGSDALIVESDLDLAELYLDQKNYQQALELSNNNIEKLNDLDVASLLVRGKRILGSAMASLGDIDNALSILLKSIDLAKKIEAEHEEAKSIISYTYWCLKFDIIPTSLKHNIEHAIELLEKMEADIDLKQAKELHQRIS